MAAWWESLRGLVAAEPSETGLPNLSTPTLGGTQFWTDYLLFAGYRIQRHVLDGHYRLLDEHDWRQAWGTFDECLKKLDQIKQAQKLTAPTAKTVLCLHGLFRTRSSLEGMAKYLADHGKYQTYCFGYASTRGEVGEHAAALASVIKHLEGTTEINFVAHSLGNLVIRHYLADTTDPKNNTQGDPRLRRFVMLGPPNNGAKIAEMFGQNKVFEFVVGGAGEQLAKKWAELDKKLVIPACEFGIIIGGRGDDKGFNPLLAGDNDFVVTVDSAKLPGARDFLVLPVAHSFVMNHADVQAATLKFLQNGYFVSADKRQPLTAKS